MPEGKRARDGFRSLAVAGASLAVLFALLTFIGWISGLQLLASVRARYIPMAPSTALCFSLLGTGILTTVFATCFHVVPDAQRGELRSENAGYPSALHLGRSGAAAEKLDGRDVRGPATGIFSSVNYPTSTRSMAKGDLVMLFTDGLFEVENATGVFFDEEKVRATVSRHADIAPAEFFDQVLADIRKYSQRETFAGDICVVGMQNRHTK